MTLYIWLNYVSWKKMFWKCLQETQRPSYTSSSGRRKDLQEGKDPGMDDTEAKLSGLDEGTRGSEIKVLLVPEHWKVRQQVLQKWVCHVEPGIQMLHFKCFVRRGHKSILLSQVCDMSCNGWRYFPEFFKCAWSNSRTKCINV